MEGHGVRTNETDSALQELLALENRILDHVTHMSANYFGTTHSKEKVKTLFIPLVKFPKKADNDRKIDYNTPPYVRVRIQYYAKDKTYRNLIITDEKNKTLFTTPSKSSPVPLVKQGDFVDCEICFSHLYFNNNGTFGVQFNATQIKVHSTQGLVQELVEKKQVAEEEVEEYEEYVVEGKSYYIQNKNHGSFIYKDGETEDEIGEEVGVFVNGVPRFFQEFISVTTGNGKVVQVARNKK